MFVWLVQPVLMSILLSSASQKHPSTSSSGCACVIQESETTSVAGERSSCLHFAGALYHPDPPEIYSFHLQNVAWMNFKENPVFGVLVHGVLPCSYCSGTPVAHRNCARAVLIAFARI